MTRNLRVINNAFRSFDSDYSGNIGFTELVEGLESMGILLELEHMRKLFSYLDINKDGRINFSEFWKLNYDDHLINKDKISAPVCTKPIIQYDRIPEDNQSSIIMK